MKILRSIQIPIFALLIAISLAFLFLPMLSVFFDMTPKEVYEQLQTPIALESLKLSIYTTIITLVIILLFGTPLAYFLATKNFPGKNILDVLIQLPIVIPPAVAGVGLIMVFGRFGWLGSHLDVYGIQIAFTAVAVIMSQVFISAPFYIMNARTAFSGVDHNLVHVSRTLGGSRILTFFKVVMPLAFPGLITGAALSWGRALGEFGATIMFAGNFPGKTQVMPLAIFSAMESDIRIAVALSALLILVAFFLLLSVKLVEYWPNIKRKYKKKRGNTKWSNVTSKSNYENLN
ncbi:ABC transporter permease [Alkalihalobacillus deserti]|uniref:ABC transporter permease n=1 Tax=Alkalihalobacillus deserti TaxID=2879466 RepID=UPI001D13C172|nr:ABC transporter permease [Alkalihalobacillus deserti]